MKVKFSCVATNMIAQYLMLSLSNCDQSCWICACGWLIILFHALLVYCRVISPRTYIMTTGRRVMLAIRRVRRSTEISDHLSSRVCHSFSARVNYGPPSSICPKCTLKYVLKNIFTYLPVYEFIGICNTGEDDIYDDINLFCYLINVAHTASAVKNPSPLIYLVKCRRMAVNPVFFRECCYTYHS